MQASSKISMIASGNSLKHATLLTFWACVSDIWILAVAHLNAGEAEPDAFFLQNLDNWLIPIPPEMIVVPCAEPSGLRIHFMAV